MNTLSVAQFEAVGFTTRNRSLVEYDVTAADDTKNALMQLHYLGRFPCGEFIVHVSDAIKIVSPVLTTPWYRRVFSSTWRLIIITCWQAYRKWRSAVFSWKRMFVWTDMIEVLNGGKYTTDKKIYLLILQWTKLCHVSNLPFPFIPHDSSTSPVGKSGLCNHQSQLVSIKSAN